MTDGPGWYGEPERHSEAAMKATETRWETSWRQTKDLTRTLVREASWRQAPGLLFWLLVYGTLALTAVGIWLVTRPLVYGWRVLTWSWTQARGLAGSSYEYFSGFALDDVLLPSITGTANWLLGLLPQAFGVRDTTRREQINANIVLIAFTVVTSVLSGGATIVVIALLWGPLLLFAWFFRGTPDGESLWRRTRRKLPVKRDYDIPFWRSE